MNKKQIIVLAVFMFTIIIFYQFGGIDYVQPTYLLALKQAYPVASIFIFFILYILVTALSLPGAAVLTVASGFIFGFSSALIMVSFASTIGATLACITSRILLRNYVQKRFSHYMKIVNQGMSKEGAFYLFSLRLIPAVPFFIINLVMGLMPIKLWTFYWVSQLGMFAGTAVFINAGAQLRQIDSISVSNILSPSIIGSFILLGLFPLLIRNLLKFIKRYRNR